jgi:hypothetical protein
VPSREVGEEDSHLGKSANFGNERHERRRESSCLSLFCKRGRDDIVLLDCILDPIQPPMSLLLITRKTTIPQNIRLELLLILLRHALESMRANGELPQDLIP